MTERETKLRTALVAVMNDIDFTEHRCRMMDPIAQCLSRESLDLAHAAIRDPDDIGPTTLSVGLQRKIHFEENIRGAGNHLASLVKNALPRELFEKVEALDNIQIFLGQLQTRAKTWRPGTRYELSLWDKLISVHATPRAVVSAIRETFQSTITLAPLTFNIFRNGKFIHQVGLVHKVASEPVISRAGRQAMHEAGHDVPALKPSLSAKFYSALSRAEQPLAVHVLTCTEHSGQAKEALDIIREALGRADKESKPDPEGQR